jgi:hypothetical protein
VKALEANKPGKDDQESEVKESEPISPTKKRVIKANAKQVQKIKKSEKSHETKSFPVDEKSAQANEVEEPDAAWRSRTGLSIFPDHSAAV